MKTGGSVVSNIWKEGWEGVRIEGEGREKEKAGKLEKNGKSRI